MSDASVRRLQRHDDGEPTTENRARLWRAMLRCGTLSRAQLERLATLGDVGAQRALSAPVARSTSSALARELASWPRPATLHALAGLLDGLRARTPHPATQAALERTATTLRDAARGATPSSQMASSPWAKLACDLDAHGPDRTAHLLADVLDLALLRAQLAPAQQDVSFFVSHAVVAAHGVLLQRGPVETLAPALALGLQAGQSAQGSASEPACGPDLQRRWAALPREGLDARALAAVVEAWGPAPMLEVGAALVRAAGPRLEPGPNEPRRLALDVLDAVRRRPSEEGRRCARTIAGLLRELGESGEPEGTGYLQERDLSLHVARACAALAGASEQAALRAALEELLRAASLDAHVLADAVRALVLPGALEGLVAREGEP